MNTFIILSSIFGMFYAISLLVTVVSNRKRISVLQKELLVSKFKIKVHKHESNTPGEPTFYTYVDGKTKIRTTDLNILIKEIIKHNKKKEGK